MGDTRCQEPAWRENVGEVTLSSNGTFFWLLPEIDVISRHFCLASSWFTFDQENWRLVLLPSYDMGGIVKDSEYVGLFLWMKSPNMLHKKYEVKLGFVSPDGKADLLDFGKIAADFGYGDFNFLDVRDAECYSMYGRLKIFCVIEKKYDSEDMQLCLTNDDVKHENRICNLDLEKQRDEQEFKGVDRLIQNLKNLLHNEWGSDVILKNGDHEFRAHMAILGARSPVFASMFHHNMIEKQTGEVDISDCSTAGFHVFLQYLYTGNAEGAGNVIVDNISPENVVDLYYIADKYQVDDLKADCVEYMKNTLSVDNFCDILSLSLRHCESALQSIATQFFCTNVKKIVKTTEWLKYLNENAEHANELIIKAVNM